MAKPWFTKGCSGNTSPRTYETQTDSSYLWNLSVPCHLGFGVVLSQTEYDLVETGDFSRICLFFCFILVKLSKQKMQLEIVSVVWIKSESIFHCMILGFTILPLYRKSPPKVFLLSIGGATSTVVQV
ncbi:hypothetical protein VNO80_30120 [Phaseolus coccineus]|uniref:Uncharacterized protein n=1 Tax=Phaseolus coccineus TaxID=3886 RepID=A0AAN9LFD4_PHACN